MDLSLFLAKLIGIYFVIMGLSVLIKKETLLKMAEEFMTRLPLMFVSGVLTLVMGLLLILSHNIWDGTWVVIVTIIGWLVFIKGLFYLLLPQKILTKWFKIFDNNSWYTIASIIMIIFGLYLAYKGFYTI